MMKLTGGEAILKSLLAHGVDTIFGLPGVQNDYFLNALHDAGGYGFDVTVDGHGNVLTAMCALHGLASDELTKKELDHADPDFEVIVTVRAVKR